MPKQAILAATALCLAAPGCDLELPPGDVKSPEYWGDVFLNKYADELVLDELEAGPGALDDPRVVLLITGVTIPAKWFEPMEARLVRDGFVPVVYEPPELLSGDLFENSVALGEVIEQVKADYGAEKIDILAECTGGLIARHYVQSLGGAPNVSRLVTFISPQQGVDKAPWAESIVGWPALADLTPGSDFLRAVNDAPLPQDVPITSIYTCTDEYIQPYETSIIPGATNIGLCDGFVGHFEFFYNPDIYLIMHDALTEPVASEGDDGDDPQGGDGDDPQGGDGDDGNNDGDDDSNDDSNGEGDGNGDDGPADGDQDADDDDDADDAAAPGCTVGRRPGGAGALWLLLGFGAVFGTRRRAVASTGEGS
ncbi:MAG: hypothetical protein AAF721_40665 [Myxococcota bacterium]